MLARKKELLLVGVIDNVSCVWLERLGLLVVN